MNPAIIAKADQTIGTTVSGWASELVRTAYADFLPSSSVSRSTRLRDKGIGLSFDAAGTVSIPSRTAGSAGGSFVGEGQPIRVPHHRGDDHDPRKRAHVPFSRELAAFDAGIRRWSSAIVENRRHS